jgi:YD repeat-containing protein
MTSAQRMDRVLFRAVLSTWPMAVAAAACWIGGGEARAQGLIPEVPVEVYHIPTQPLLSKDRPIQLKIADESANETANGIQHAMESMYGQYGLDYQRPIAGSTQYEAACPNYWGATFDVPFGRYDGNRLISVPEDEGPTFAYWRGGIRTSPTQYDGQYPGYKGGWAFSPGATLYATLSVLYQSISPPNGSSNYLATCKAIIRFDYDGAQGQTHIGFAPPGAEQQISYMLSGGAPPACVTGNASTDPYNTYWSNDGQILLDVSTRKAAHPTPSLHYPDGTIEVFATLADGGVPGTGGPSYTGSSTGNPYQFFLKQRIDRNGNVTTFNTNSYTGGHTTTVTDPQGRVTTYTYATNGQLSTITAPGPNGSNLTYTLHWASYSWDSSPQFPDVTCLAGGSPTTFPKEVACGANPATYTTLASMTLPDGRSYQFSYADPSGTTLWGALTQVTRPDGSVHRFGYGNSSTPGGILPADWQDIGSNGLSSGRGGCPTQGTAVLKRRVVSETEYPQGLGATGFNTLVSQDAVNQWIQRTRPDGSVDRRQISTSAPIILAEEQWTKDPAAGGALVEGVYNTYSSVYFGSAAPYLPGTLDVGDFLVTKVKHVRDGATWWELFTYGDSTAFPSKTAGVNRNFGNVTKHQVAIDNAGAPGTVIQQTETAYKYGASYSTAPLQNFIRLPGIVKVEDGVGNPVTRTDYGYDASTPVGSGAQHLSTAYIVGGWRGNVTSSTHYLAPVTAGGPVTSNVVYFDNGEVQKAQDPNGHWVSTVTAFDFADCSGSHTRLTTTTQNALGHSTTSVHDCSSLKALSVTDPNGQKACTQYDGLGRLVESAAPGDTLSSLPQQSGGVTASAASYLRDASCAINGSATVGAGGAGPTTWTAYYPFGLGGVTYNQARTVSSVRDGTSNGLQTTVFVDGLGRTIEQCHEVDPATYGGSRAACTSTVYDNMGRVFQAYVPFSASAMPTTVVAPGAAQYQQTVYDAIGRPISQQLMRSGAGVVPAITTSIKYTWHPPDPTWFPQGAFGTYVTDPNGWWTEDDRDFLGRVITHWDQTGPQSGAFVRTIMRYDAANRLTSITDPSGNVSSFTYDGLGRKTKVSDPDLGAWSYVYDNNGNMTQQTDARGAVTHITYDALNRVTLRDLPYLKSGTTWVSGTPGEEDELTFYDSASKLPTACYTTACPAGSICCDDHCSSTNDICSTATLSCTHTGTACASPNQ